MSLSVFQGFSQDMVLELTGLSASQLKSYRDSHTVNPNKIGHAYLYKFQDVLILKLINRLIKLGVTPAKIRAASKYFNDIDPTKSLLKYNLYIRQDRKEILYLGDSPKTIVNANKWGQLVIEGVLLIIPVGKAMEQVRTEIIELDSSIRRGAAQNNLIPFRDSLKKHHGIG